MKKTKMTPDQIASLRFAHLDPEEKEKEVQKQIDADVDKWKRQAGSQHVLCGSAEDHYRRILWQRYNGQKYPFQIREFCERLEAWGCEEIEWQLPEPGAGLDEGFIEFDSGYSRTLCFETYSELLEYETLDAVLKEATMWSCCGVEVDGMYEEFMICPICHEHL